MIYTTLCINVEDERAFKILTKKRVKGENMTKWLYKKLLEDKK